MSHTFKTFLFGFLALVFCFSFLILDRFNSTEAADVCASLPDGSFCGADKVCYNKTCSINDSCWDSVAKKFKSENVPCLDNKFCDVSGHCAVSLGDCANKSNGTPCGVGRVCYSGGCFVDVVCWDSVAKTSKPINSACGTGKICDSFGRCVVGAPEVSPCASLPDGSFCGADKVCYNKTCSINDSCWDSVAKKFKSFGTTCLGGKCDANGKCVTACKTEGDCSKEKCCLGYTCDKNFVCQKETSEVKPITGDPSCTGNTSCQACIKNSKGICECTLYIGARCGTGGLGTCLENGVCSIKKIGETCSRHDECISKFCEISKLGSTQGVCIAFPTPPNCKSPGLSCSGPLDCCSNICSGGICASSCNGYCQQQGKAGGICQSGLYSPFYPEFYRGSLCQNEKCMVIGGGSAGAQGLCENSKSACFCYDLEGQDCLPDCVTRCSGGSGCRDKNPENCCNGGDDDLDGMVDAEDSDCSKSSSEVQLQVGDNNVCWKADSYWLSDTLTRTSKIFSCPKGYYIKANFDYIQNSKASLKAIDANNERPLTTDFPTTQGQWSKGQSIVWATNRFYFSIQKNYGTSDLKLNQISCVTPKEAGLDACSVCGQTGTLWGLFNFCDETECNNLGSCFYKPGFLVGGNCYPKAEVKFSVFNALTQERIKGVSVVAGSSCITDENGECSLTLGLGLSSTAYISASGYVCKDNRSCQFDFTMKGDPTLVPIEIYKTGACFDSDSSQQFPNGAKNYYQKGVASETFSQKEDACSDNKTLVEYSCSRDGQIQSESHTCSLGCLAGTCLTASNVQGEIPVVFKVGVGEGALKPVAGMYVNADNGTFSYSCRKMTDVNGQCLMDLLPGTYTIRVMDSYFYICASAVNCPKPNVVIRGGDEVVTIQVQKDETANRNVCVDSDQGDNPDKKGVVSLFSGQQAVDYCKDISRYGPTLVEYYCSSVSTSLGSGETAETLSRRYIASKEHQCKAGCQDGACLEMAQAKVNTYDATSGKELPFIGVSAWKSDGRNMINFGDCDTDLRGECLLDVPPASYFIISAESNEYGCCNCTSFANGLVGVQQPIRLAMTKKGTVCPSSFAFCAKEGEYLDVAKKDCCVNTKQIQDGDKVACINCGNGVCISPETQTSCPADCTKSCTSCGKGLWNMCDESECLGLGSHCAYFDKICINKSDLQGLTSSIPFQVFNVQNGTPLKDANIKLMYGTSESGNCKTDIDGKCHVEVPLARKYSVSFSAVGFQGLVFEIEPLKQQETLVQRSLSPVNEQCLKQGDPIPTMTILVNSCCSGLAPLPNLNHPGTYICGPKTDTCKDYDNSYYLKSLVVDSTGKALTDHCLGDVLKEGVCEQNVAKLVDYACSAGCLAGACKFRANFRTVESAQSVVGAKVKLALAVSSQSEGAGVVGECLTTIGGCFLNIVAGQEYIVSAEISGYQPYTKRFVGATGFNDKNEPLGQMIILNLQKEGTSKCDTCGTLCSQSKCSSLGSNCVFDRFFSWVDWGNCKAQGQSLEEEGLINGYFGGSMAGPISDDLQEVWIDIPAGAVDGKVKVRISRQKPENVSLGNVLVGDSGYEIKVIDISTGREVHNFNKEITIRIKLRAEILAQLNPANTIVKHYNSETKQSEDLPVAIEDGYLVVRTKTLSWFWIFKEVRASQVEKKENHDACTESDTADQVHIASQSGFYDYNDPSIGKISGYAQDGCSEGFLYEAVCPGSSLNTSGGVNCFPISSADFDTLGKLTKSNQSLYQFYFKCNCPHDCENGACKKPPASSQKNCTMQVNGDCSGCGVGIQGPQCSDKQPATCQTNIDGVSVWQCNNQANINCDQNDPEAELVCQYVCNTKTNEWNFALQDPGKFFTVDNRSCACDEMGNCIPQSDAAIEVFCSDLLDNDNNGKTDCQDDACKDKICDTQNDNKICQNYACVEKSGTGTISVTKGNTNPVNPQSGSPMVDPIAFGKTEIKPPSDLCSGICANLTGQDLTNCQASAAYQECLNSPEKALLQRVLAWLAWIAFTIAGLIILIGAFMIMTSSGDKNRITRGKQMIIWASVGLAVLLASRLIIGVLEAILDINII